MRKYIINAILAVAFAGLALQTQALTISPGSELINRDEPIGASQIISWINNNTSYVLEDRVYKIKIEGAVEEGDAKDYYSTSLNGDQSAGTITWDGLGYIANAEYLLIKDGNHSPAWYLFSLAGWDGQENIELSGFWPGGGSISDISVFAGTSVPDSGATGVLLGLGVVGLAAFRRKE